jgi:hypothetical protein
MPSKAFPEKFAFSTVSPSQNLVDAKMALGLISNVLGKDKTSRV